MDDTFRGSYGSYCRKDQKFQAVYADAGIYRTGISATVSGIYAVYSYADAGTPACFG